MKMMKPKTLMIGAAVAAGVYLLLRARSKASPVGWWQALPGMTPGTQQAAMLAQQDAEFYGPQLGYLESPY